VGIAQIGGKRLVVRHQLAQHVARRHELRVIALDALHAGDLANGAQRRAADLADSFGELVGVDQAP